ncbi:MAG TPA: ABC transporter ATP-binding protein [Thermodesulfobacteriota bacterium]
MIQVEGLTKRYGRISAIEGLSFSVEKGEIVGFLGLNGAGKTTTMRILTGFIPPTRGRASIAGHDVVTASLEARRHVGYLPESAPLYTDMPVRAYLDFVGKVKGVAGSERPGKIDAVLSACGIAHVADRQIGRLSKGYRQRVGLAQALLGDPDVLVLDEPTSGLDPAQIREIRELIRHLAGTRTVILSTHILPEVEMICSRVLIVHRGRLLADGRPDTIGREQGLGGDVTVAAAAPADTLAAVLADLVAPGDPRPPADRGVTVLPAAPGEDGAVARLRVAQRVGTDLRPEIARAVVSRGWPLLELHGAAATLESVFISLVTKDGGPHAEDDAPEPVADAARAEGTGAPADPAAEPAGKE